MQHAVISSICILPKNFETFLVNFLVTETNRFVVQFFENHDLTSSE